MDTLCDVVSPWALVWVAVALIVGACVGCGLMAVLAAGASEDAWRAGEREGFRRATGFADLGSDDGQR